MLARRKKVRLNNAPKTEWPKHRAFVRRHVCIVPACAYADQIPEACHVRAGLPAETPDWARGGTSRKPHDAFTFPACRFHHHKQHTVGEYTFAQMYNVNPLKEALDLARHSPCDGVREFIREHKL